MGSCRTDTRARSSTINIMFGDLKSAAGVKALNEYLAENSYIEGYVPSQADTAVFEALAGAPKDAPHALRWYNHIKSFAAGMKQFPKASKDAAAYTTGGSGAAAAGDDDDDVDLSEVMERRMTRRRRGLLRSVSRPTMPRKPKSLR